MGILLPVVGWSDQRRKSNYASFQCLQALGYQSLGYTVWLLAYAVITIAAGLILLVTMRPTDAASKSPLQNPGVIAVLTLIFAGFAVYFVLPIIAGVACALGRDFRYPLLGNRLARYVAYDPSQEKETQTEFDEDHEFRWVAAMGHFSILIVLWGMLAPLTAWVLQGKQSPFLKFQSVQAFVFQGIATVISLIAGFLYIGGLSFLLLGIDAIGGTDPQSPIGRVSILGFIVLLAAAVLLILLLPFLHILGQWAGYRVLKGEDFHYPLIGSLVETWIARNSTREEKTI